MYCPHCGAPAPDGKPFCPNCGQRLSGGDPFRPGGDRQEQTTGSDTPPTGGTSYHGTAYGGTSYNGGMMEPVRTVTFGQAVRAFFANYATFSGRATRSEFWFAWLFNCIVTLVVSCLATLLGDGVLGMVITGLGGIYGLAILLPSLAIAWRRLHDSGRSGGFWFLSFIPLVGGIIVLVFYCMDSAPDNQYGPRRTESNRNMYP